MFNLFPFTNFHDLNLDWIIKSIKTLYSKVVFTVNNTMPDENGNVNLPTVAGVSSVNGIGADGNGNVEVPAVYKINNITPDNNRNINIKTLMPPTYKTFSDYTSHYEASYSSGFLARSGVAEIKMEGTIKAGTQANDVLATLPNDAPLPYGYSIIYAIDDNNKTYRISIDNTTNQIKVTDNFLADTPVHIYGCYLLIGDVAGNIVSQ